MAVRVQEWEMAELGNLPERCRKQRVGRYENQHMLTSGTSTDWTLTRMVHCMSLGVIETMSTLPEEVSLNRQVRTVPRM
jgi:hypothetical protein